MADLSDIPDEAVTAPVVEPTTPGPLPGIDYATNARLDAIEVDLRGGYVRSGEHIAEDPDEFRDEQFVNVADLPSIIHAWASAALSALNTAKDSETREAIAVEFERFADTWGSPIPSPSAYIAQALRDRAAEIRAASLRGEQP